MQKRAETQGEQGTLYGEIERGITMLSVTIYEDGLKTIKCTAVYSHEVDGRLVFVLPSPEGTHIVDIEKVVHITDGKPTSDDGISANENKLFDLVEKFEDDANGLVEKDYGSRACTEAIIRANTAIKILRVLELKDKYNELQYLKSKGL